MAFRIEELVSQEELAAASELLADLDQKWIQVEHDLQRILTEGVS